MYFSVCVCKVVHGSAGPRGRDHLKHLYIVRREHSTHTEHLGGKWSYCAARVGDAKQGMKTADFLPFHNQIPAFLSLQQWSWSLVEHQRRGSAPATPTQHMELQTWVLLYLSIATIVLLTAVITIQSAFSAVGVLLHIWSKYWPL